MNDEAAVSALAALAQPTRLAAYRALVQAGPEGLMVGALRGRLDVPAATLTAHLHVLRRAGLVDDERDGRVIHCRANFVRMNALLSYLTDNCCGGKPCGPNC